MSLYEWRVAIESSVPWWAPFALIGACLAAVAVLHARESRRWRK